MTNYAKFLLVFFWIFFITGCDSSKDDNQKASTKSKDTQTTSAVASNVNYKEISVIPDKLVMQVPNRFEEKQSIELPVREFVDNANDQILSILSAPTPGEKVSITEWFEYREKALKKESSDIQMRQLSLARLGNIEIRRTVMKTVRAGMTIEVYTAAAIDGDRMFSIEFLAPPKDGVDLNKEFDLLLKGLKLVDQ